MKQIKELSKILLISSITVLCYTLTASENSEAKQQTKIVLASEIKWEKLNPARGDKSPQAGTLWGDRKAKIKPHGKSETDCAVCSKGMVPTGFLAKFVDGFSSPPHIHNVTYRAVVISGRVHNDDPDAAEMWMPPGSFWTQPKGEVHITSAKGESTVALVEIDTGPYLVMPPEKAFDSGERPVNIHASNVVWVTPPGLFRNIMGPKMAFLWGDPENGSDYGTFIKIPAGSSAKLHSTGSTFRAVSIQGQPKYSGEKKMTLNPGSYFSSSGDTMHQLESDNEHDSIFYIRTNGSYGIIPVKDSQ